MLVNYYCTMAGIKVSILTHVQREHFFNYFGIEYDMFLKGYPHIPNFYNLSSQRKALNLHYAVLARNHTVPCLQTPFFSRHF